MGRLRSARIEDRVGRGGCHDRSLNVASVTGPVMLLILKDLVQTGADSTLVIWYLTMKSYTHLEVS